MRVVIAPDKFKGCLSAPEAALAMARGVAAACREAEIDLVPMADGGEGTVDALVAATNGTFHEATVTGPLGDPVNARFGVLGDGETAVLEMAAASGLVLVPPEKRDPRTTTTRGTGELIRIALDQGAKKIIIGIGGSATNDGGAGMAQALGARLLDENDKDLPPGGAALASLAKIDVSGLDPRLDKTSIRVACDVDNPLCGPTGASAVYGPQKGATLAMIVELDAALDHYSRAIERDLGRCVAEIHASRPYYSTLDAEIEEARASAQRLIDRSGRPKLTESQLDEMIKNFEHRLRRLEEQRERHLARWRTAGNASETVASLPGAGAAGGLGAGLVAFAMATLEPGVSLIEQVVRLDDRLESADLCLTAEGAIDASSAFGKTAVGVARLARSRKTPCLALAGMIGDGASAVLTEGIDAYVSIAPGPGPLDEAIALAAFRLERATEQLVRAFLAGRRSVDFGDLLAAKEKA